MFEMLHFATIYDDGTVHVQNYVSGMAGQHHVHTLEGYRKWKGDLKLKCSERKGKSGEKCDCGLSPGQLKEYTGHVWENKEHKEWR